MSQIIISSHGKLASGMKNTLEYFGAKNIIIIEQTVDESNFENKIRKILRDNLQKNCIVFTDLLGGSVNQYFFKCLKDFKFHLITGMNLQMILECVFKAEDLSSQELLQIIDASKQQCCYMNNLITADIKKGCNEND